MSPKRRWLFRALLAALLLGIAELCSCVALTFLSRYYPMDPIAMMTPEKVEGYLAKHFDPNLGWSPRPTGPDGDINSLGARSRREYTDLAQTISTYGDSYTFCDGVDVADAWPTLLEAQLLTGVLNFGVGGYGTDQALMRLEQKYPQVPSHTVILGVQPENINRIVSVYRGFYQAAFGPPKPFFELKDGALVRHHPFATPEAVRQALLHDRDQLIQIALPHDRWLQEEMLFGRPWGIRFPYTIQMAARVPFLWSRLHISLTDIPSHAYLYHETDGAFALMKAIIRAFTAHAAAHQYRGVIVILPPPRDVARYSAKRELNYQPLVDFLAQEKIPFLDMMPDLAAEPDLYSLYVNRSGHYARKGSLIIAEKLAAFLQTPSPAAATADQP